MDEFCNFYLGLVDYWKAWRFQREVFQAVKEGLINQALIVCRHHPVVTLGKSGRIENFKISFNELALKGGQFFRTERGGDITYHGPGQLTIYPICNLRRLKKDIHWYLRCLEEAVISWLGIWGVSGQRRQGLTGVWVGDKKICSIGVAIDHWISFHGLSVNIKKSDLSFFSFIRPCGMDIQMTCLEGELNRQIDIDEAKDGLVDTLQKILLEKEYPALELSPSLS